MTTETIKIKTELLAKTAALGYSIESSMAGLMPGYWPEQLEVPGMGNGRPFQLISLTEDRGRYLQERGALTLNIWNT